MSTSKNTTGIDIRDYDYDLPQERIAQFPLERRDMSKLLIYQNGTISGDRFISVSRYLPADALLVFNHTRVIHARLKFVKESGAVIEIFCLEPVRPTTEMQQAFECTSGVTWKCLVGNSKRWKQGTLELTFHLADESCKLIARRIEKQGSHSLVEFTWEPAHHTFSEVIEQAGLIPLPPYMKREAEESDNSRYQTVYARAEGSVAAPTAGLHFTEEILKGLKEKGIKLSEVTLHVGAGTFKPVTADNIREHKMHTEKISVSKQTIINLLHFHERPVIVTGTTTLRTVESIYWHGVKLIHGDITGPEIDIQQWDPYDSRHKNSVTVKDSLLALLENMDKHGLDEIGGRTQLLIVPGYRFSMADILITNFHLPRSTLLLLVAAFIGDSWKKAYQYALDNDFRFLSYGDACLFFREK